MKREQKRDYRVASDISDRLSPSLRPLPGLEALAAAEHCCNRSHRRMKLALARGWTAAYRDAAQQLATSVEGAWRQCQLILDQLRFQPESSPQQTAAEIYRDLRSLRDHFNMVRVDPADKSLTVRTAEIELESVLLGAFDICLHWGSITSGSPYDVIAVDPNPACSEGETTHPHVQHDKLCEGEGATLIRRALAEGRLLDFFCVVDRILRTYNPDSAYVALEHWGGVTCGDCGATADRDQSCRCETCRSDLCHECRRGCCGCSDHFCTDCVSSCTACDDAVCGECRQSCSDCGETFCSHCLNEGVCDDCLTHQDQETETCVSEQPSPTLQPVCLGETAVSA